MTRLGTTAKGNDYRWLGTPELGEWSPTRRVTVVIPVYRAQAELDRTVAALETQTYPSDLFGVVVVDDGSEPPIERPAFSGDLRLVRQERRGFGAPRARNRGAAEADGEVLLFLDCDMIPERTWVEAHARWHHMADDIVTLGTRSHLDVGDLAPETIRRASTIAGLFEGRDARTPAWLDAHYRRTADLVLDHGDLFRVVTSGNLGVSKEMFLQVGGFDESFDQWGGEDIELGYRLYTAGALLVPEPGAHAWHQGPGLEPDPEEAASLHEQRAKMSHLIAHRGFRSDAPGRSYAIPRVTVNADGGTLSSRDVAAQVESVLASDHHDLIVAVQTVDVPDGEWLRRQFDGDPRVLVDADPEETHPYAEMRVELPPGLEVGPTVIRRLAHAANNVGVVEVHTAQGPVRLGRTRALARVGVHSPSRWVDAAKVFGIRELRASDLQLSAAKRRLRDRLPTPARKAADRLAGVRSWEDFRGAIQWVAAGLAAVLRLRRRRLAARLRRRDRHVLGVADLPKSPLPGIFSTNGEGFSPLPHILPERLDLVYGTKRPSVSVLASIADVGGIFVEVADGPDVVRVPPFDPRRFNPVDWVPSHDGSDRRFPRIPDPDVALRRHRSVAIPPPNDAVSAGRVVRLAALGAVLAAAVDGEWTGWLGEDLGSAILTETDLDDPNARELRSVRQRRAALANHTMGARRSQLRVRAGLTDNGPPAVTVLLATNRPDHLPHALSQIALQRHRPLDVVLALHGDGFDDVDLGPLGAIGATIVRAPSTTLFGDLLNLATEIASGDLISKMDDDDHYGPHHLTDLVVAAEYSGADLVGKGAEFIHLQDRDRTVRRIAGEPETPSRTIGGGALAIHRRALKEVGGWARVRRGVDQTLISAVLNQGGTIHRTHGFGYILVRRPEGHTWDVDPAYFERDAAGAWDGLARDIADID